MVDNDLWLVNVVDEVDKKFIIDVQYFTDEQEANAFVTKINNLNPTNIRAHKPIFLGFKTPEETP